MPNARPQVPVMPGPNMWRVLRTDRDGATADELPQMAAAAMRVFLASPGERGRKHELVRTGKHEWRFGRVRPMHVIHADRERFSMPTSQLLGSREHLAFDLVPTVSGKQAWQVVVVFWWRGPQTEIDWPALKEGLFGRSYELTGADWLLDEAVVPPVAQDPGDQTWAEAMGSNAEQAVRDAAKAGLDVLLKGGSVLGWLALAFLLLRKK